MVSLRKASLLAISSLSITLTTQPKFTDYLPFSLFKSKKIEINQGQQLLDAVRTNEPEEKIMALIEDGADINYQDKNGATALMVSTLSGNLELTKTLLDKSADPNLQGKIVGLSPIILAVHNNNDVPMAQLLLEKNANPNLKTYIGFTALMYAVLNGNTQMVDLLISKGANVNDQEFIAGLTSLIIAIANKNTELTDILLANGADVKIKDKSGQNAINYAKETKAKEIIDLVVPEGYVEPQEAETIDSTEQ